MFKNTLTPEVANPVNKLYRIGKLTGSAGPEMVWRIYEGTRIDDNKVCGLLV